MKELKNKFEEQEKIQNDKIEPLTFGYPYTEWIKLENYFPTEKISIEELREKYRRFYNE